MTILFQQSCQPHFPMEFMSKLTIALTAPQRTYLGGGKCRTDLSGSKIRMPGGKMLWLDVNNWKMMKGSRVHHGYFWILNVRYLTAW